MVGLISKFMKYLFIFTLLVMGCGQKPPVIITIDPKVQPYVDQWNGLYPDHLVDVDVIIGDLSSTSAVGICDGVKVTLDSTYWERSSDLGRQQVLFHELGHCVFNYAHDWGQIELYDNNGNSYMVIRSIMYPFTFGEQVEYSQFHDYYEKQLGSCQTCTSHLNGDGTTFKREDFNGVRID
jgi:hypothetical protein